MNYNKLNSEEERVIVDKATEHPFTGEYDNFYKDVIFLSFHQKASLNLDVDGQALMSIFQMQLDLFLILME